MRNSFGGGSFGARAARDPCDSEQPSLTWFQNADNMAGFKKSLVEGPNFAKRQLSWRLY